MPRTQFHKKLGILAGGAARTGQSNAALIGKVNQLEKAIGDSGIIPRLDRILAKFEDVLGKAEPILDQFGRRKSGGGGAGGASRPRTTTK